VQGELCQLLAQHVTHQEPSCHDERRNWSTPVDTAIQGNLHDDLNLGECTASCTHPSAAGAGNDFSLKIWQSAMQWFEQNLHNALIVSRKLGQPPKEFLYNKIQAHRQEYTSSGKRLIPSPQDFC